MSIVSGSYIQRPSRAQTSTSLPAFLYRVHIHFKHPSNQRFIALVLIRPEARIIQQTAISAWHLCRMPPLNFSTLHRYAEE